MDVFSDNEHHQHEVRIFAYCMELSKKDTLFVGSHSLAEHGKVPVADPGFLQGECGSWCLWSAPSPFMPSLPPTLKKISWELAAR